jgi:hypothetical protein
MPVESLGFASSHLMLIAKMFFSKGSEAEAPPAPPPGRILMPMSEVLPESNVLRKVASLTLDRAIIDQKVARPKNVPQKLEYQIYEKFEGRKCVEYIILRFSN